MPASPTSQKKSSGKELTGVTVLVTRTHEQAPELTKLLRARGARVSEVPVIEIAPPRSWNPLDAALRQITDYDWLILTSVNGVHSLRARLRRLKIPAARLRRLKIAAIGPATRAAVREIGLNAAVMPREYVAEAVVAALKKKTKGAKVLLVRAAQARDVLPRELARAGAHVHVVAAYETRIPKRARVQLAALLRKHRPDLVTCTSSSTVHNFLRLTRRTKLQRNLAFAAIGPVTAATLHEYGLRPAVQARDYTMQGLVQAIVRWRATQGRASGARGGVDRDR